MAVERVSAWNITYGSPGEVGFDVNDSVSSSVTDLLQLQE